MRVRRGGTGVCHASHTADDRTVVTTAAAGFVTRAADQDRLKLAVEGVESFVSESAQQLSACACVIPLAPDSGSSSLSCIEQLSSFAQQSIRASGVDRQPAHSPHPVEPSERATTSAPTRVSAGYTRVG